MDTDVIVVRRLNTLPLNVLAWQVPQNDPNALINGAFMAFEKQHPFTKAGLEEFAAKYSTNTWAGNGPELLTRVWKYWPGGSSKSNVSVLHENAFYMFPFNAVYQNCFINASKSNFEYWMKILREEAYVVHLNSNITGGDISKLKERTFCSYLLNKFCVICNKIY
jgi:mannosyltransferase OCH1-like enzyme